MKKIIRPEGPAKKNNLAPILSEKNILAWTKNPTPPPPPLNIKWTVPKTIIVYSVFVVVVEDIFEN